MARHMVEYSPPERFSSRLSPRPPSPHFPGMSSPKAYQSDSRVAEKRLWTRVHYQNRLLCNLPKNDIPPRFNQLQVLYNEPQRQNHFETRKKSYDYVSLSAQLQLSFRNPTFCTNFQYLEENFGKETAPFDWFNTEKGRDFVQSVGTKHIFIGNSTDGLALNKSAGNDAWPLLAFVMNLCPNIRHHMDSYLCLSMLLFSTTPSSIDCLLVPYYMEVLYYGQNDLHVYNSLKSCFEKKRIYHMQTLTDLQARHIMFKHKTWKSPDGCSVCNTRGATIGQHPHTTISFNDDWSSLKTVAEWTRIANEKQGGGPIYEPCVARVLPYFNFQWRTPIEKMHLLSKGIEQGLLELTVKKVDGKAMKKMRESIQFIVPDQISRGIRPLDERGRFKASEIMAFTLYYCVPLLEGLYSQNSSYKALRDAWMAVRKVELHTRENNPSIVTDVCEDAYRKIKAVHGDDAVTMKRHLLRHFPIFVAWNGDPRFWRADGYESFLSFVRSLLGGISNVSTSIVWKLQLLHYLPILETALQSLSPDRSLPGQLMFDRKRVTVASDCVDASFRIEMLGAKTTPMVDNEQLSALVNAMKDREGLQMVTPLNLSNPSFYNSTSVNGCHFQSKHFPSKRKERGNYVIQMTSGTVCEVQWFIAVPSKTDEKLNYTFVAIQVREIIDEDSWGVSIAEWDPCPQLQLFPMSVMDRPIVSTMISNDNATPVKLRHSTIYGPYRHIFIE